MHSNNYAVAAQEASFFRWAWIMELFSPEKPENIPILDQRYKSRKQGKDNAGIGTGCLGAFTKTDTDSALI